MSVAPVIPEPRPDDDEDVHWALSTASALWARGEAQEALKWLRRAAETASDANRDARSLDLFKAAADISAKLESKAPGVSPVASSQPSPDAATEPAGVRSSHPPPLPPHRNASGAPAGRVLHRPSTTPGAPVGPVPVPNVHISNLPAPASVEPMAPTLPRGAVVTSRPVYGGAAASQRPGPPPKPLTTPPMNSSPQQRPPPPAVQAKPHVASAKTLASNSEFERALANATSGVASPTVRAQDLGAARPTNERATTIGLGHEGVAIEPPPASPAPKSARRSTRTGRRGGSMSSSPNLARGGKDAQPGAPPQGSPQLQPLSEADTPLTPAPPDEPTTTQPRPANTRRFEVEATMEEHEHRVTAVVRYDDLDEATNVMARGDITGQASRRKKTARVSRPPSMPPEEEPPRSSSQPPKDPKEAARISAFKVALSADPVTGAISITPLAPNEPAPANMALAILVPVDGSSSAHITALMNRPKRGG